MSTKIQFLRECISEYRNIPVRYIDGNDVKRSGKLASCMTPKENDGIKEPFIKIYNTTTNYFYDIAKEGDPFGTECIMNMIRQKMIIPEGTDAIFYSVFALLHEVGHYYDYKRNPDKYSSDYYRK